MAPVCLAPKAGETRAERRLRARSAIDRQSQQVIALATTGQSGMAAVEQIRLAIVTRSDYVHL